MASNNVIDNLQKAIADNEQAITLNKNELTILKANILKEKINTKHRITNKLNTKKVKTFKNLSNNNRTKIRNNYKHQLSKIRQLRITIKEYENTIINLEEKKAELSGNLETAEFQKLQKEVNNTPFDVRHAVSAGFGALITEKGKIPYLSGKKILFI